MTNYAQELLTYVQGFGGLSAEQAALWLDNHIVNDWRDRTESPTSGVCVILNDEEQK